MSCLLSEAKRRSEFIFALLSPIDADLARDCLRESDALGVLTPWETSCDETGEMPASVETGRELRFGIRFWMKRAFSKLEVFA